MNKTERNISVVIPSLDPFGSQYNDVNDTLMSILKGLNGINYEVLLVTPEKPIRTNRNPEHGAHSRDTLWGPVTTLTEEEPGHSGALNTGARAAKGSHILVLNPGDLVLGSPRLSRCLTQIKRETIYCLRVISERGFNGGTFPICEEETVTNYIRANGLKVFAYLPHQGLLIPKTLFQRRQLSYNSGYKLRMDFDLLMQLAHEAPETRLTTASVPIAYYPPGGISQEAGNAIRFIAEELTCTWKYRNTIWPSSAIKLLLAWYKQLQALKQRKTTHQSERLL